ncbi:MAG: hypothetical protein GXX85_13760 [Ignavibacteria bacterium]|nr:hypothetical protein [Ignavibacteria bacterium]
MKNIISIIIKYTSIRVKNVTTISVAKLIQIFRRLCLANNVRIISLKLQGKLSISKMFRFLFIELEQLKAMKAGK